VTTISAYLKKNPNPTLAEVREACKGNFCRCGTYPRVFEAALARSVLLLEGHLLTKAKKSQ